MSHRSRDTEIGEPSSSMRVAVRGAKFIFEIARRIAKSARASSLSQRSRKESPSSRASAATCWMPYRVAAICASRSAIFSSGLRDGFGPVAKRARTVSRSKSPRETARNGASTTPSSASERASGGNEPGRVPPISAWCARTATYATRSPSMKTGATVVTSGRCEPPNAGWFVTAMSPSASGSVCATRRVQMPSAPRWTGKCGAF